MLMTNPRTPHSNVGPACSLWSQRRKWLSSGASPGNQCVRVWREANTKRGRRRSRRFPNYLKMNRKWAKQQLQTAVDEKQKSVVFKSFIHRLGLAAAKQRIMCSRLTVIRFFCAFEKRPFESNGERWNKRGVFEWDESGGRSRENNDGKAVLEEYAVQPFEQCGTGFERRAKTKCTKPDFQSVQMH